MKKSDLFGSTLQYLDYEEWMRLRKDPIIKHYQDNHKWCFSYDKVYVKHYELLEYPQVNGLILEGNYFSDNFSDEVKLLNKIPKKYYELVKCYDFSLLDKLNGPIPKEMTNLEELHCSCGFGKDPEVLANFKKLKILHCSYTSIKYIPKNLTNLENLCVDSCNNITKLPEEFKNLEYLYARDCSKLTLSEKILDTYTKLKVCLI